MKRESEGGTTFKMFLPHGRSDTLLEKRRETRRLPKATRDAMPPKSDARRAASQKAALKENRKIGAVLSAREGKTVFFLQSCLFWKTIEDTDAAKKLKWSDLSN